MTAITPDALRALAARLEDPDQYVDACDEAAAVLLCVAGANDSQRVWTEPEPVHGWFELSYAQYLTIPRSVLQSMPEEWQRRFVRCLCELDDAIDWRPERGTYRVTLNLIVEEWDEDERRHIDQWGSELDDPLADYERGRRRVALRGDSAA